MRTRDTLNRILAVLFLLGPGSVLPAQENRPPVTAIQQCKCRCNGDDFLLAATTKGACEELSGSPCDGGGTRALLEQCTFLFIDPTADDHREDFFVCKSSESWYDCFNELLGVEESFVGSAPTKDDLSEQQQDLSLGASSPSGASTKTDFLHRLLIGLDIPGLTEEDGLISFRYNTPGEAVGFEAKANQAELFEKLKMAIPEADRAAKAGDLEKELGEFDDISVSLNINIRPTNTRLRRNLETYAEPMWFLAQEAKRLQGDRTKVFERLSAFAKRLEALDLKFTDKVEKAGRNRAELDALMKASTESLKDDDESNAASIERVGVWKVADLAANQPQFYFDVKARLRDDLVGPDELEALMVWEIGLGANLNMLKQRCGQGERTLKCYDDFFAETADAVRRKWRFKLEAGYGRTGEYRSPVEGIGLDLDKAESLIAKVTWGGVLSFDKDAEGKTIEQNTFALEAVYEDVTGDEQRNNRLVAKATLTQRVTDDMSLELTALWANKPEYLGEVDEELGARAGVRYKFNRPQP